MNIAAFLVLDQLVPDARKILDEVLVHPHLSTIVTASYLPCVTPVGHATLSTGEIPGVHGVIGRRWWTRERGTGTPDPVDIDLFSDKLIHNRPLSYLHEHFLAGHNLCSHFDERWFCLSVAAKDFVSFILGGRRADLVVFPQLDAANSQWVIYFRCNSNRSRLTQQQIGDIDAHLHDLDRSLGRPGQPPGGYYQQWDGTLQSYLFAIPHFRVDSVNAVEVDRFYSRCIETVVTGLIEEPNVLICQSLFNTDVAGHQYGCNSSRYVTNVAESGALIRDFLTNLRAQVDPRQNLFWYLSSDHGGRPVAAEVHLERALGSTGGYESVVHSSGAANRCGANSPSAILPNWLVSTNDLIYQYEDAYPTPLVPSLAAPRQDRLQDCCNVNPVPLSKDLLASSFNPVNMPDMITVPEERSYLTLHHFGHSGSHGAGYSAAGVRSLSDCQTPVFHSLPAPPQEPTVHEEVQRHFLDACIGLFRGVH